MVDRRGSANRRTGALLAGLALTMVGLSFAAVPLYRLFCQATGFGGTTQIAARAPMVAADRVMTVRFNADVDPRLPWRVQATQTAISVKVGETGLGLYRVRNLATRAMTGTATYNVTPLKAGRYFSKIACFCFDRQRLDAGEEAEMAVSFFVDPAILEDRNLEDVKTITLSYSFFPVPGELSAPRDWEPALAQTATALDVPMRDPAKGKP